MFFRDCRDNQPELKAPATVSSFRLDCYEITVGRFRAFVEAQPEGRPAHGLLELVGGVRVLRVGRRSPADVARDRSDVRCLRVPGRRDARGFVLYRQGHASGADVVHRVTPYGTEDSLVFWQAPPVPAVVARLVEPAPGLRERTTIGRLAERVIEQRAQEGGCRRYARLSRCAWAHQNDQTPRSAGPNER
jgi:hypothetical protein